jgi:hypothetical protein
LDSLNFDRRFHRIEGNVFSKPELTKTQQEISAVCDSLKEFLIDKNNSYGNSALDPVRIFSKCDNVEQLMVRIDDKLSRFARGSEFPGDNDIDDLLGYLVLLKVAHRNNWR